MNGIGLVVFLGVAVALLVLLLLWVRQPGTRTAGQSLAAVREALAALNMGLPPRGLVERIFAQEDLDYVRRNTPGDVLPLFLDERRRLAVLWLRSTKLRVQEVMVLYRRAVRANNSLRAVVEVRPAVNYALFLLSFELMRGAVWMFGPFAVRGAVSHIEGLAEHVSVSTARLALALNQRHMHGSNGA